MSRTINFARALCGPALRWGEAVATLIHMAGCAMSPGISFSQGPASSGAGGAAAPADANGDQPPPVCGHRPADEVVDWVHSERAKLSAEPSVGAA